MNKFVSSLASIPARLERAAEAALDVFDDIREAIPEKLGLSLMVVIILFIAFLLSLVC